MSVELYATIWMLPAIYRKYKTNNFSKIRQDLPELFFFMYVYEIRKIFVPVADYA